MRPIEYPFRARVWPDRRSGWPVAVWLVVASLAALAPSAEPWTGERMSPASSGATGADLLCALIVDGQNNHANWPTTSQMMRSYLEETGLFQVEFATTRAEGVDPDFHPDFQRYDVVISNYNGAAWPKETRASFERYVAGGGGFVSIHAADNAFGDWPEYNRMIGLGGWGGRDEKSGPLVYFDDAGNIVRDDAPGPGGSHGQQHAFRIVTRDADHPVTRGLPQVWMHANDELYDRLRGPAENMEVLASAFSDPGTNGSGRHEPMVITVQYGRGRVFHTPLGHGNDSQECVGFITLFQRGAQWAATGEVTQEIPPDFPTADETRARPYRPSPPAVPHDPSKKPPDLTLPPLVVFLTGDEEYRSEESMPMLAKILRRDFGFRVKVCYALADDGTIDPNNRTSIDGIESLDAADLAVLFTRYRDWPERDFAHFQSYVEAGKPLVGFRTATHAFNFTRPERAAWNDERIADLVGQKWIAHHGHFGDGQERLTAVEPVAENAAHPILRGVAAFRAYSWLYHVEGGGDVLRGSPCILMRGTALKSNLQNEPERYPPTQPTAWTKTYRGAGGNEGRVFFSTTAHPYDFLEPYMRRLALHGILWALGRENLIPPEGCACDTVGEYAPNNSGFGQQFKTGQRPDREAWPGVWTVALGTPGGPLECGLEIRDREGTLSAWLINGPERIPLDEVVAEPGCLRIEIPHYDSRLVLQPSADDPANRCNGHWTKRRGAAQWARLEASARRGDDRLYEDPTPFLGRWAVRFESADEPAIGEFSATASRNEVSGTFLTTSGDYRFLAGGVSSGVLTLSCFDGAHAFLFRARLKDDQTLHGDFWSGDWWHDSWTASLDANAELPDPLGLTRWNESTRIDALTFADLKGHPVRLSELMGNHSATIIEVFGSWCPNCHDAAPYLRDLETRYGPRGLRVVGLAFELTGDSERDADQVRRFMERHAIDFPILLAGVADKDRASDQFPLVDRIRSYPTFVFLGRDRAVRAIYTGFNGPATGAAHAEMKATFERTIQSILE